MSPVFIPLGGSSWAQCLSRLAGAHGPSIYPAWLALMAPAFIPLGGQWMGLTRTVAAQASGWNTKALAVFGYSATGDFVAAFGKAFSEALV